MSEPLQLSALFPWLALAWIVTLPVAFANLAIDGRRGTERPRPLVAMICDWVVMAGGMSIVIVLTELHSHKLLSLGAEGFVIVMLLAIMIASRLSQAR